MITKLVGSTDRRLFGIGVFSFLGMIALLAIPAMSAEISADGKGDLLPIDEDGVSQESNTDCKTDLGVTPTSPNCQSGPKQTFKFRTIVV